MNVLQLAIGLEEQLEQYYLEQAGNNEGTGLASVFRLLAREERKHAELLRNHEAKLDGLTVEASKILEEAKALFVDMLPVRNEIKSRVDQLDVYRFAQEKERDSIVAYEKLLSEVTDEAGKEVFTYLIGEEKKHYQILGEMADFLSSPEEWVENAEFGLRKEY